jgi:transcriptional regulator with XRE-family HTH domain
VGSPKSISALKRLGDDVRSARLRRGFTVADLAVRAGTSPSSLGRLEKGEAGVAIGTLADILVALGLGERLADLIDIRIDDVGLALAKGQMPRRGKSFAAALRRQNDRDPRHQDGADAVDPDGVAF